MIPKTLHFCWFGDKRKPALEQRCLASWRRLCPGWEIREWTLDDFSGIEAPAFFRAAVAARKWAFASDWARFWIVLREGGVYLDADVELIAPIDDLIDEGGFFACSSDCPREVNPGLGFAAERGDAIVQAILERYDDLVFDPACHLSQTSPAIVTEILQRFPHARCLPARVFNPKDGCSGEMRLTPETRAIHHYSASWFNWKQRLAYVWYPRLRKFLCR